MPKRHSPGVMYDAFAGNSNVNKTYDFTVKSIALINTGAAPIAVTVGDITATVPADKEFDELVIPTKAFSIQATDSFVCTVRADG